MVYCGICPCFLIPRYSSFLWLGLEELSWDSGGVSAHSSAATGLWRLPHDPPSPATMCVCVCVCVCACACAVKSEYYCCIYCIYFKVEDRQVFIYGHWHEGVGVGGCRTALVEIHNCWSDWMSFTNHFTLRENQSLPHTQCVEIKWMVSRCLSVWDTKYQ